MPLHELRRRFELNGDLDDVAAVQMEGHGLTYVGLPPREAEFLATLVRDGDVGVELSPGSVRADRRRRLPDEARQPTLTAACTGT